MIRRRKQALDTLALREYELISRLATRAAVLRTSRCHMDIDEEKLEQVVLALLHLNSFDDRSGKRAWKGFPWGVMNQLHEKGYISDPATKSKSVRLSEEGAKLSEQLFKELFTAK